MPPFSRAEMDRRVGNLRQALEKEGLDGVIATSFVAIYYLAGVPLHQFGRPAALVVPREGEAALVTQIIEKGQVEAQTWVDDRRHYWDYNPEPVYEDPHPPLYSLVHHLKAIVADRGLSQARLGIEDSKLPLSHYQALREAFPKATLIGASDLLDRLRMVLSEEELALIRAADAIGDVGQEVFFAHLSSGKSAEELAEPTRRAMQEEVLRRHPDKPFVLHAGVGLGSRAKLAGHSAWVTWNRDDRAQDGQLLLSDFGATLWGYKSHIERTISIGPPRDEVRRLLEIEMEANEAAIAAIKPGLPVAELDRICKDVLAKYGYMSRTGSGLGRGMTNAEANDRELRMDLRLYSDVVLEPGMAFELAPDLFVPDVGLFLQANTVIVTEDGCLVDSRTPRGVLWV